MSDFSALSRSDWLELAARLYGRIDEACASLTPAEWERVTPYMGWRARDVLAHLTGAIPVNFREVPERDRAPGPGRLLALLERPCQTRRNIARR